MFEPRVSVVMNCFNSERYLREAIDSVFAQTYRNWEIVFFDNASTDRSPEIAKSYDERLRYIRGEGTVPLGEARNAALSACQGDFVAFLDCDDLWSPNKLELQIPLFKDAEVGLVYSNNTMFAADGARRYNYHSVDDYAVGRCFGTLLRRYFLAIPTVIVRRTALDGLAEKFDPRFCVCEEVDLFLRIAYAWKLAMVNDTLAGYRLHAESETWRKSEKFLAETRLILEKFRMLYPRFDVEFCAESEDMLNRAYWSHAVFCWRDRRVNEVRRSILAMSQRGPKQYIFLAASHIPYRWLRPIMNTLGRTLPV